MQVLYIQIYSTYLWFNLSLALGNEVPTKVGLTPCLPKLLAMYLNQTSTMEFAGRFVIGIIFNVDKGLRGLGW
jgi:hypothetical protein